MYSCAEDHIADQTPGQAMMMDETDKVIELELGCVPEAAISGGVLIQTDQSTFLTFNAERARDNQRREGIGHALVEFPRCLLTQFGYPNDEALAGHPLYASGLRTYGIFEVLNSSWGKRIDEQNRVAFPKFGTYAARHFIITFTIVPLNASRTVFIWKSAVNLTCASWPASLSEW